MTMSRSIVTASLLAIALVLGSSADATAQARIGGHVGLNTDGTDLFIGAISQFGVAIGERDLWGEIGLEIYPFIDNVFVTRLNANALFPLVGAGGTQFYGGGGLVFQATKYDLPDGSPLDDSDTDIGLNLVAGMLLSGADSHLRPFLELNQTVGAGSDFAIRAGVFFKLGK
jgi:hypothetical protein